MALALLAAPAAAASSERMRAGEAVERECAREALAPGTRGVAIREWTAPEAGLLSARLRGGHAPDWDLAVLRAGDRRPLTASTSATSNELATAWVKEGDRVTIQACRRDGRRTATLALRLTEAPAPHAPADRVSLESVAIRSSADIARLERLGFDVTEDVSATAATVVLHSAAERTRLAAAGFLSTVLVRDLASRNVAERRADRRYAQRTARSALPSGRDTYRVYSDYTTELKALADANPGLVRSIVIGHSVEGRPIEGVEIAPGVERTDDGRPVYLNMGLHHAREWPSGEYPMEFAIDLVNGFNAANPRITSLLSAVRVVIVPVVNPDGFIVSRETAIGEFRRKNCRPTLGDAATPCALRSTLSGVDLNRNYGAYWGGAGSSDNPSSDVYRGPAPFSEPESQAVHELSSGIHPTVFITNHTFTNEGVWLRQPGFSALGTTTPDEPAMKSLGDAMAGATGWLSQLSWQFREITGATEDWNYFAQGTYGYTSEARGRGFHDAYADMVVEEYLGDGAHAGLGVREAFLLAGERAADPAHHGIVAGAAPPGATLGLHKEFATPTSQPGLVVNELLATSLRVPASGAYAWHVNPSSRPLVDGEVWTMTCAVPSGAQGSAPVAVGRGEQVTVNWSAGCSADVAAPRCGGKQASIAGTSRRDSLRGTRRRDVIFAGAGADNVRALGRRDVVCGGAGKDRLYGGMGRDDLRGGGGRDRLDGGSGRDRCRGGAGADKLSACR